MFDNVYVSIKYDKVRLKYDNDAKKLQFHDWSPTGCWLSNEEFTAKGQQKGLFRLFINMLMYVYNNEQQ